MNWLSGLKAKVLQNEPLSKHTTFKIGGPVKWWIEPVDDGQLIKLFGLCKKKKILIRVIGAGSNLLVADRGIRAAVIRLRAPFFTRIESRGNLVEAGAGFSLAGLVAYCTEKGFSGVEFLTGIPGTIGGALVMNAGVSGRSIGDLVEFVTVMHYNGAITKILKKDLRFRYRQSNLDKAVILLAGLRLLKRTKSFIKSEIFHYLRARCNTKSYSWNSAGCVFKNPQGDSAGRLIDTCGFKGRRSGGAIVSPRHANYILNNKNASASDVLKLMRLIQNSVWKKYNIRLEPEIKIWK
jgi:UDP-N-acetylmuramate dehydrogenase